MIVITEQLVQGQMTLSNPRPNCLGGCVGVMQLADTLAAGGLERVAVNLANALPEARYRSHLCTTRQEGPLATLIAPHVGRLRLNRSGRFDLTAIPRLAAYVRQNGIQILHAHGTALFIAVAARLFARRCAVLWHDHYGRHDVQPRRVWLYRPTVAKTQGVIAVNEPLAAWTRNQLGVSARRVWYLPNFVAEPSANLIPPELPGKPGARIACVANLRPQKDHPTLLQAMKLVAQAVPEAHLVLAGQGSNDEHQRHLTHGMQQEGLADKVTWLGARQDVAAILKGCDIGVLSSVSEGLPLALLEYGMAGLPVVSTRVGQCAEVLEDGHCGLLVSPGSPEELARGILSLLGSPEQRRMLGGRLRERIRAHYSVERVMEQVCGIYDAVLPDL